MGKLRPMLPGVPGKEGVVCKVLPAPETIGRVSFTTTMISERETAQARVTRVLDEHRAALIRLAASYTRSPDERADLLQDIALAFFQALEGFRGECSEKTFLLRVAHNRALTSLARRGQPTEDIADHDVVATTGKNPAIAYERSEHANRLLAAVRALPVPHRQVITLLLEGLSHREIAEVTGASENNVAVRASRARVALRTLMENQ